jgi:hypothetical protein
MNRQWLTHSLTHSLLTATRPATVLASCTALLQQLPPPTIISSYDLVRSARAPNLSCFLFVWLYLSKISSARPHTYRAQVEMLFSTKRDSEPVKVQPLGRTLFSPGVLHVKLLSTLVRAHHCRAVATPKNDAPANKVL